MSLCPVCWVRVRPTKYRNTAAHMDSIGRAPCPFSGQPYDLALTGDFLKRNAA